VVTPGETPFRLAASISTGPSDEAGIGFSGSSADGLVDADGVVDPGADPAAVVGGSVVLAFSGAAGEPLTAVPTFSEPGAGAAAVGRVFSGIEGLASDSAAGSVLEEGAVLSIGAAVDGSTSRMAIAGRSVDFADPVSASEPALADAVIAVAANVIEKIQFNRRAQLKYIACSS
jgi:hypothetical protein